MKGDHIMTKLLTFLTETDVAEKADFLSNEWVQENKYILLFIAGASIIGLAGAIAWKKVFKKHRGYRG